MNLWAFTYCETEMPFPQIDPVLEKVVKEIGWHSCSDEELLNAHCKTKKIPSLKEMKDFIESHKSSEKDTEEIHGNKFRRESVTLLDAFRELTTRMHHMGIGLSLLPDKEDLKDKYNFDFDCKNVECAMTKIWGEEMGTQILYIYLKHGFNSSEYSYAHSSRFTPEEMSDVLMALGDLPPHFQKLGWSEKHRGILNDKLPRPSEERPKAQRLSRFTMPNQENSKQIADATISLMPLWSTLTSAKRQYTIYHELAHNTLSHLPKIDLSPEWLELSGWKKLTEDKPFDPNEKWSHNEGCFVSGYAAEKPQEDYAESITAYRYAPERFKEMCPKKYAFIKQKVYNNIEYLDSKNCEK